MNYLYQITGQKKYLDFCEYIIRRADAGSGILSNIEKTHSVQSVGNKKAYEMLSNYVGLVHYWRSTGDKRALQAAISAWESVKNENMYITGSPEAHEHFVEPNTLATDGYCVETCVQVTWIQLTKELLFATGDSRYAAALHHHYYNHMLAAQQPDGVMWCYMTPMEWKKPWSDEVHCCSSNGPRAIAWIPTIAYIIGKKQIAVNFYETSAFKTKLNDVNITLCQKTDYPWDGNIIIDVVCDKPVTFDLQLLVPEFVRSGKIEVADSNEKIPLQAGKYAIITRTWTGKTPITLKFEMPIVAHQRNERYALSRGPIVFALENIQNSKLTHEQVIPDISELAETSQQTTERFRKTNQTSLAVEHHLIYIKGKSASDNNDKSSDDITLVFRPYCEAGANGEVISVWLPKLPTPPWRLKQ